MSMSFSNEIIGNKNRATNNSTIVVVRIVSFEQEIPL